MWAAVTTMQRTTQNPDLCTNDRPRPAGAPTRVRVFPRRNKVCSVLAACDFAIAGGHASRPRIPSHTGRAGDSAAFLGARARLRSCHNQRSNPFRRSPRDVGGSRSGPVPRPAPCSSLRHPNLKPPISDSLSQARSVSCPLHCDPHKKDDHATDGGPERP